MCMRLKHFFCIKRLNRDELCERDYIQLDMLQDSQRGEGQLVHSSQQMSV